MPGTTTDNENDLATGWLPGELSELGRKQSTELGKILANKQFDAVFCSDLKRAVDSSELAFGKKYKVIQDSRLREANYGDWNGKPNDFKELMLEYEDKPFPNGESLRDVENRIRDFCNFLTKNYDGKRVAILAHQYSQLAFEVVTKGKTWKQAIAEDWRKTKSYQPGWDYEIK